MQQHIIILFMDTPEEALNLLDTARVQASSQSLRGEVGALRGETTAGGCCALPGTSGCIAFQLHGAALFCSAAGARPAGAGSGVVGFQLKGTAFF